jgi:hypothetical protein
LVLNPYRAVTADESGVHNATGLHDNLQRSKTVSGEIDAVNDLVSLVENGPGLKQNPHHLTFDRAQGICRKRRQQQVIGYGLRVRHVIVLFEKDQHPLGSFDPDVLVSLVTSLAPHQSSTSWSSTRRLAFSIASVSSAQTKGSNPVK